MGAWLNVMAGPMKIEPTSQVEVLRQPIFSNPLVTNVASQPLRVSGLNERRAIIKDLWDPKDQEWKSLSALRMNSHIINVATLL